MSREPRLLYMGVLNLAEDRGDAIHARAMIAGLRNQGAFVIPLSAAGSKPCGDGPTVTLADRRFLRQLSWNVRGTRAAVAAIRTHGLDCVYSRLDPGMVANLQAARLTGKPLVVEMNGFPSSDIKLYGRSNRLLNQVARIWETVMYRGATRIVGARGYIDYVQEKFGVDPAKCIVAPLGVDTELFRPMDQALCRSEAGFAEGPMVVWSGQFTAAQGLATLVETIGRLREHNPDCRWLLVGDGPLRADMEAELRARGAAGNVILTGRVRYADVPRYLGCASACVATFPAGRGVRGGISALKTLTYLACGRPTITTAMDELARPIAEADAGIVVEPDDADALAAAIAEAVTAPAPDWAQMGRAARSLAEDRTWNHKARIVLENLRAIL